MGIPNGKGLLSPIVTTITKHRNNPRANITLDTATKHALQDWHHIIRTANQTPTPCTNLIPTEPDYIGYCDASKTGAGGVWFGGIRSLPPIVWRIPFPEKIQQKLVSQNNPSGTITNSDLEMAGLLMHWIVLESVADVQHAHVAAGCDNTPTVAWTSRLLASKARTAAHLVRALALRMLACQASPLAAFHIAGEANRMADFASRSIKPHPDDQKFLTHFSKLFPTPQTTSWHLFQPHKNISGKLYSALQTTTSPMAWWLQITNKGTVIGSTGSAFSHPTSSRTFKTYIARNKFPSFKPSSNGSDKATSVEATKYELARSRMQSGQSARPSNWMATPTHSTDRAPPSIISASNVKSKPSNETTRQQNLNSLCPLTSQTGYSARPAHQHAHKYEPSANSAS